MTDTARLAREQEIHDRLDRGQYTLDVGVAIDTEWLLDQLTVERQRREALEQASGALVDAMCVNGEFYPVEIAEQAEALRALLPRVGGEG